MQLPSVGVRIGLGLWSLVAHKPCRGPVCPQSHETDVDDRRIIERSVNIVGTKPERDGSPG